MLRIKARVINVMVIVRDCLSFQLRVVVGVG